MECSCVFVEMRGGANIEEDAPNVGTDEGGGAKLKV